MPKQFATVYNIQKQEFTTLESYQSGNYFILRHDDYT